MVSLVQLTDRNFLLGELFINICVLEAGGMEGCRVLNSSTKLKDIYMLTVLASAITLYSCHCPEYKSKVIPAVLKSSKKLSPGVGGI